MKSILVIAVMLLTGCSTQQLMCAGTGTCYSGEYSTHSTTSAGGSFTASNVQTPIGNYLVVPNYSTGRVQAIVQTSRGK